MGTNSTSTHYHDAARIGISSRGTRHGRPDGNAPSEKLFLSRKSEGVGGRARQAWIDDHTCKRLHQLLGNGTLLSSTPWLWTPAQCIT